MKRFLAVLLPLILPSVGSVWVMRHDEGSE